MPGLELSQSVGGFGSARGAFEPRESVEPNQGTGGSRREVNEPERIREVEQVSLEELIHKVRLHQTGPEGENWQQWWQQGKQQGGQRRQPGQEQLGGMWQQEQQGQQQSGRVDQGSSKKMSARGKTGANERGR